MSVFNRGLFNVSSAPQLTSSDWLFSQEVFRRRATHLSSHQGTVTNNKLFRSDWKKTGFVREGHIQRVISNAWSLSDVICSLFFMPVARNCELGGHQQCKEGQNVKLWNCEVVLYMMVSQMVWHNSLQGWGGGGGDKALLCPDMAIGQLFGEQGHPHSFFTTPTIANLLLPDLKYLDTSSA